MDSEKLKFKIVSMRSDFKKGNKIHKFIDEVDSLVSKSIKLRKANKKIESAKLLVEANRKFNNINKLVAGSKNYGKGMTNEYIKQTKKNRKK